MDTRKQILDAAKVVFEKEGLARVTTKSIARQAGCAEGTLYNYFEGKEDLCLAMLKENLPNLISMLGMDQAGKRSVPANLEEMASGLINFCKKVVPLGAALFADPELLARHRKNMLASGGGPHKGQELIANYIRAEQALGRISRNIEAFSVAALIFGSCFQYVYFQTFSGNEPRTLPEPVFVKNLVSTLMEGLNPRD